MDDIATLTFSADSSTLVTLSQRGTAHLWDVANGHLKTTLQGLVRGLAISTDMLATTVRQPVDHRPDWYKRLLEATPIQLWDIERGGLEASLCSGEYVEELAWSPDGTSLAAWEWRDSEQPARVRLWDVLSRQSKRTLHLPGSGHMHSALAFSADGRLLATGGQGSGFALFRVHVWELASGHFKCSIPDVLLQRRSCCPASAFTFSPQGSTLATGHAHAVSLWDAIAGQIKTTFEGHTGWKLAFSPDGKKLAIGSINPGGAVAVSLWDVASATRQATLEGDQPGCGGPDDETWVTVLAFSPDGKTLAAGTGEHAEKIGMFYTASVWDVASGQRKWTFPGVSYLAFSPDGETVATMMGTVGAWSASETQIAELKTVRLWSTDEAGGRKHEPVP
jgi:WD40 repeat protein